jgi:DNA primase large subunit
MHFGSDDLAKYPFLAETGEFVREQGISVTDLVKPEYGKVVSRAEERVLEAIKSGRVSDRSLDKEIEIMSFPISLLLVRSTKLDHLMNRYALAEAMRVESFLNQEKKQSIIEDIFTNVLKIKLERGTSPNLPDFRIYLSDYLRRASAFHAQEWKLVNKTVQEGKVYVSQHDLIRLIREEIRDLIMQRLKSVNVPRLPKQLDEISKKLVELTPPPRSAFAISRVDPENYPPCTKPEEVILGDNLPINQVSVGGFAIGQTGLNSVTATFCRQYSGPMVKIKAQGLLPVELTPEHPVLVSRSISSNAKIVGFTDPDWKQARDTSVKPVGRDGDYLVTPLLNRTLDTVELDISPFMTARGLAVARGRGARLSLPLTKETAWLMGIYVAEGWSDPSKGQVVLGFDQEEVGFQDLVLKIARELGYSPRKVREETVCKCFISSFLLARAFRAWFGHKAPNKKIPDFIMLHKNDEILRAFLKGWEDGDGYRYANKNENGKQHFSGATTSKVLGLQLQLLYMSLNIGANLTRVPRAGHSKICGRDVVLSDMYLIDYSTTGSNLCRTKRSSKFFFHPIRRIELSQYDGPVHNIETADNTYLVSNAVVHNCVKEALGLLTKGQNVPHYGRFLLATYLLATGKSVDDIMALFPKSPDFKQSVTKYQVEHIAGLKGGRTKYSVPLCKTLLTHSFCFKDPVKCYGINSPMQYPSKRAPSAQETRTRNEKEEKRTWTKTRR